MHRITILSSCGEFEIDYDTGRVITPRKDRPEEYRNIRRFNVEEHKQFHKDCCDPVKMGAIDILDIGFWYQEYAPPEQDWREMMTGEKE